MMAASLLVACGSGEDEPVVEVDAGTYSAVLNEFLPPAAGVDEDRPVVYVAPLGAEPLSLDDQIVVIDAVAETHDVRFVDDLAAAIDAERADGAPRDDGLLIGMATVKSDPPHTVRVEVYADADEVVAHMVTVSEAGDVWQVDGMERVDPEGLVGDE